MPSTLESFSTTSLRPYSSAISRWLSGPDDLIGDDLAERLAVAADDRHVVRLAHRGGGVDRVVHVLEPRARRALDQHAQRARRR